MELTKFLEDWKSELKDKERSDLSKSSPLIYTGSTKRDHPPLDEDEVEYTEKQPCLYEERQPVPTIGGPGLFLLPGGSIHLQMNPDGTSTSYTKEAGYIIPVSQVSRSEATYKQKEGSVDLYANIMKDKGEKGRLVDQLISDLVSRSWYVLAEDNTLWINICHSMGYDTSSCLDSVMSWKHVVKELVLRKRRVQQNWMERMCGISDHQPDHAGSLCCAAYYNGQILMCYSYGESHLWSLGNSYKDIPVKLKQHTLHHMPNAVAIGDDLAAVGNNDGSLNIFDLNHYQQIYTHIVPLPINHVAMTTNDTCHSIALVSGELSAYSNITVLMNLNDDLTEWKCVNMDLPGSAQLRNFEVKQISLIPTTREDPANQIQVLYSTNTSLSLQSPSEPYRNAVHILAAAGDTSVCCVNCFTHSDNLIACGIFECGWNELRLYDLPNGIHKQSFKGHYGKINCVEFDNNSLGRRTQFVSGSEDKRVIVHDYRDSQPVMRLSGGHTDAVLCVQMDDWKVVSGSRDGTVIFWDLRKGHELWNIQERHPVSLCIINDHHLITAHVPSVKVLHDPNTDTLYIRQRGLVRIYDFSVDPLFYTRKLPSICSSNYNEPTASFHHLDLRVPYDIVQ